MDYSNPLDPFPNPIEAATKPGSDPERSAHIDCLAPNLGLIVRDTACADYRGLGCGMFLSATREQRRTADNLNRDFSKPLTKCMLQAVKIVMLV